MTETPDAIAQTHRFARSLVDGDADTLEALLAPDGCYVHASAWLEPGHDLVASVRNGRRYARLDFEDLRVRSYGDTQIVNGLAHLVVGPADAPIAFDSRFSAVWTGTGEASRLALYHSTRVPEQ